VTTSKIKAVSDGKLERRRRLIEATITAVARYGLNHITLEKVANIAGLVAGTVNFHFNGKDELLLESMRYLADTFSANLQNALKKIDKDPVAALNEIIDIHIDPTLSSRDKIVAWYSFWVEVSTNSHYRAICSESETEYASAYIRICEKILSSHKVASDLQVRALAKSISGMMNQTWEDLIVNDTLDNRQKNKQLCQAFFASIFPWLFELPQDASAPLPGSSLTPMAPAHFPAWIFTNEALVELEKKELLKSSWHWLGSAKQLPAIGSYRQREVLSQNVLLIKNQDCIRAFYNVCKHHPHMTVSQTSGTAENIVCGEPYGWTYDLSGILQQWPANLTLTLDEKNKLGLGEIVLNDIKNSLWVCFNPAAQMNQHSLTFLQKTLSDVDFLNDKIEETTQIVSANWKIIIDMYLSRQLSNMQKNIDINDKCTMPSQEMIEQTFTVQRKSGVRTIMLPNMIMLVIEQGVYVMQFLPLTAKETQLNIFATGLDKNILQALDSYLQKVITLTTESQRCLTPYGYSDAFSSQIEPARALWRAKLQEILPVLRLSVSPVLEFTN
jgi:TetR/AcrR family transcriptional repressor of bet genes